jgi:hypothetical protein
VHRCPALIDAATWQQANDILAAEGGRTGGTGPAPRDPYMLRGAISCGNPECTAGPDSPMYRIARKPYAYYRCTGRGPNRGGCGTLANLADADAAVDHLLSTVFTDEVQIFTVIAGNKAVLAAQLADIDAQLLELPALRLPEADEDAERARLRAWRREVETTPRTADSYGRKGAGYTYAERWAEVPVAERGGWLTAHGFRVTATRGEITVTQTDPDTLLQKFGRVPLPVARPARSDGGTRHGPRTKGPAEGRNRAELRSFLIASHPVTYQALIPSG